MSEFNVGDLVLITDGVRAGMIGTVVRVNNKNYTVVPKEDGYLFGFYADADILEYVNPNYYVITEMATVVSTPAIKNEPALHIEVNPDRNREGNPYFKVLDTERFQKGKSKVCRLHFKDENMEYHTGDGLLDWKVRSGDIKAIRKLLMKPHEDFPEYTNWEMTCWLWNLEYGFFVRSDRKKYFEGKFDNNYKNHTSYVPSTQEIPKTWNYDPPKRKNKR